MVFQSEGFASAHRINNRIGNNSFKDFIISKQHKHVQIVQ